jgi:hypothetical protein
MAYNMESALTSSKVVKGKSVSIEYCCFGDNLKLDELDSNFRANLTSTGFDLTDISSKLNCFIHYSMMIIVIYFIHDSMMIIVFTLYSDGSKDAKMKGFINLLMWCFHHPRSSVLLIRNYDNYRDCIVELDGLRFQMMFAYVDPIDEPTRRLLEASPNTVVWSLGTLLNGEPPLTEKELRLLNPPPLQLQNKKRKNSVRG